MSLESLHTIPREKLNAINLAPLPDDSLVVLIGKLSRECWTCDDPMQDADERKNDYAVSGRLGRVGTDRSVAILAYGQSPLLLRRVDSRTFEWLLRGTGTATLAERCVFQHVLACRLLFARALDEAQRRGVMPTQAGLLAAWDLAQHLGRVQAPFSCEIRGWFGTGPISRPRQR